MDDILEGSRLTNYADNEFTFGGVYADDQGVIHGILNESYISDSTAPDQKDVEAYLTQKGKNYR